MTRRTGLFAALAVIFDLIHDFMDQWGQPGWAAANKGKHGDRLVNLADGKVLDDQTIRPDLMSGVVTETQLGRIADTAHVALYTAGQLIAAYTTTRALGHRINLRSLIVGHVLINGVTHWVIDRRAPLHALAKTKLFDKESYIQHATVVRKPGTAPEVYGPGTASFELDKSLHRLIGLGSALTIALLATRRNKARGQS